MVVLFTEPFLMAPPYTFFSHWEEILIAPLKPNRKKSWPPLEIIIAPPLHKL